jgi:hypothetical protein
MWKKLDGSASLPLDSSSNSISSESVSEMLMGAIRDSSVAKEQLAPDPRPELPQDSEHMLHPMLREYVEVVDKCARSASEFIRCASLLSEARDAYEKLRTLRGEIQKVLADDEENLIALMDQVQKTADTQMPGERAQSTFQRKAPDSSNITTVSVGNGERGRMIKFP